MQNLDEAYRMLDAFASVGARHFDVTFPDIDGAKRGFRREQSVMQLRNSLPKLLPGMAERQNTCPRSPGIAPPPTYRNRAADSRQTHLPFAREISRAGRPSAHGASIAGGSLRHGAGDEFVGYAWNNGDA